VQHLEGLGDAVERLTGTHVRETLPDSILELADDVIFVDVTPEVLRDRLREGKIYPRERVDTALSNFFRAENLAALRELTVRELMHARRQRRHAPPFARIVLGVRARERDATLIERMGRLSTRLSVALSAVHVCAPGAAPDPAAIARLKEAARLARAQWQIVEGADAAAALVATAKDLDTIVVESPRGKHRLFTPASFAVRLLRAPSRPGRRSGQSHAEIGRQRWRNDRLRG
jgi:two-component system sensor histidine kinase KdpD